MDDADEAPHKELAIPKDKVRTFLHHIALDVEDVEVWNLPEQGDNEIQLQYQQDYFFVVSNFSTSQNESSCVGIANQVFKLWGNDPQTQPTVLNDVTKLDAQIRKLPQASTNKSTLHVALFSHGVCLPKDSGVLYALRDDDTCAYQVDNIRQAAVDRKVNLKLFLGMCNAHGGDVLIRVAHERYQRSKTDDTSSKIQFSLHQIGNEVTRNVYNVQLKKTKAVSLELIEKVVKLAYEERQTEPSTGLRQNFLDEVKDRASLQDIMEVWNKDFEELGDRKRDAIAKAILLVHLLTKAVEKCGTDGCQDWIQKWLIMCHPAEGVKTRKLIVTEEAAETLETYANNKSKYSVEETALHIHCCENTPHIALKIHAYGTKEKHHFFGEQQPLNSTLKAAIYKALQLKERTEENPQRGGKRRQQ